MRKLHKIKWQKIKVKLKGDAENINKVTKEAKNAMIESYKVTRKLQKTQKCSSCVTKISCTTIGSLLSRQTIRIMGSVQDIIQFDHCSKPTDLAKNGSIRFQKVTARTARARFRWMLIVNNPLLKKFTISNKLNFKLLNLFQILDTQVLHVVWVYRIERKCPQQTWTTTFWRQSRRKSSSGNRENVLTSR